MGIVLRSEHIESSDQLEIHFNDDERKTTLVGASKGRQVEENEQQKAHKPEEQEEIIEPAKDEEEEEQEVETGKTFEEKTESNRKVEEAKPTTEVEAVDEEEKLFDEETSAVQSRSIEETSEVFAKKTLVEMKNEDYDNVGKQTHENLQAHVDPTHDSELQKRSAGGGVSAGKTSEIANSSLITLVIIANYVIARVL